MIFLFAFSFFLAFLTSLGICSPLSSFSSSSSLTASSSTVSTTSSTNPNVPLFLSYTFDKGDLDTAGTKVKEYSSGSNNRQYTGLLKYGATISTTSSIKGSGSLYLPSQNSFFQISSTHQMNFGSYGITILFWFRSNDANAYLAKLFEFGNSFYPSPPTTTGRIFYSMEFGPVIEDHFLSYEQRNSLPQDLNDGSWHFFAWRIPPPELTALLNPPIPGISSYYASNWTLFIDGKTFPLGYQPCDSPSYFNYRNTNYLGKALPSVSVFYPNFVGSMDEFRVYDGVLTDSEIKTIYVNEVSGYDPSTSGSSSLSSSSSSSSSSMIVSIVVPLIGFIFGIGFVIYVKFQRLQSSVGPYPQQGAIMTTPTPYYGYQTNNQATGSFYPQTTSIPIQPAYSSTAGPNTTAYSSSGTPNQINYSTSYPQPGSHDPTFLILPTTHHHYSIPTANQPPNPNSYPSSYPSTEMTDRDLSRQAPYVASAAGSSSTYQPNLNFNVVSNARDPYA